MGQYMGFRLHFGTAVLIHWGHSILLPVRWMASIKHIIRTDMDKLAGGWQRPDKTGRDLGIQKPGLFRKLLAPVGFTDGRCMQDHIRLQFLNQPLHLSGGGQIHLPSTCRTRAAPHGVEFQL
jgi:hypothetical protein